MSFETPYDPPPSRRRSASVPRLRRSSSISSPAPPIAPRSQSPANLSDTDFESSKSHSDDETPAGAAKTPLVQPYSDQGPDPRDEEEDRKAQRPGRMSKGWEKPGEVHSDDMEDFLAQLYELTHSIDALENDVDDIVNLRNKFVKISPPGDVNSVSIRADLDALASLTTKTGKTILSLETWLTALHARNKQLKKLVKSGQAHFLPEEFAEIRFQVASAKLDFADAMEQIREGAWKEQERRERIEALLKAAELGAADGVERNNITSYAGLWALNNPYTELAELTHGMRFLHDDLDADIVRKATGKDSSSNPKAPIYLNAPSRRPSSRSTASYKSSRPPSYASRKSKSMPPPSGDVERRMRYISREVDGAEKDIEWGFTRQKQLKKSQSRKKAIIALLVVIIAGLLLLLWFATMPIPYHSSQSHTSTSHPAPSSPQIPNDPAITNLLPSTTRTSNPIASIVPTPSLVLTTISGIVAYVPLSTSLPSSTTVWWTAGTPLVAGAQVTSSMGVAPFVGGHTLV